MDKLAISLLLGITAIFNNRKKESERLSIRSVKDHRPNLDTVLTLILCFIAQYVRRIQLSVNEVGILGKEQQE